jgi:hypothetical protein
MKTIRILLAMLLFSLASFTTPQSDHSDQLLPIFHAIKYPKNQWSIRPLLKDLSEISNDELTAFLASQQWEADFNQNGASIFSTNDLTTLEKFWAWALVLTIEQKLSLENFAALLDTPTFGQIPERVIINGLQIIVDKCPVFALLAERQLISKKVFEKNSFLLPLRCDIPQLQTRLSESDKDEPTEFSSTLSDYKLAQLWKQDKSKFPQAVQGIPLIFWAIGRDNKNKVTLSLFDLIYSDEINPQIYSQNTIWEHIFKSGNPELASYILQNTRPCHFKYLVLVSKEILQRRDDLSIPPSAKLWHRYFVDHPSLEKDLENARRNFSINLINSIKKGDGSWKDLIGRTQKEIYQHLDVAQRHPLEEAVLCPNLYAFGIFISSYDMQVTSGILAEKLVGICIKNNVEKKNIEELVKKIDRKVLQQISEDMKTQLKDKCPRIDF